MVAIVGSHPGAVWRKIDLQSHTPRDRGWGAQGIPGGTPENEAARRHWASEFVNAAVGKGLKIISVTDHHDIVFLPYVISASKELDIETDFFVFPGVEVTCKDGVQCLAIFDSGTNNTLWNRFLTKLPNITVSPHNDERIAPVRECGWNIDELIHHVNEDSHLCDKVLIIPHFSNEDAHKSLNTPGHSARARDLPCDGVYVECPYSEIQSGTLEKIQGRTADWGTRRRAIIVTGDNKQPTWDRLGAYDCWIKIGEHSLEGLRQSFLADQTRITYQRPDTPGEIIKEMTVKSNLTGENPIRLVFNECFTAIIGGRGSGKSSFLEYLRFGLGRAEADITGIDTEIGFRRERERQLIDTTLAEGWVELVIEREGIEEKWRREGAASQVIAITRNDGSVENISIQIAQKRFPARAFHQKELSTTMVVPDVASENITSIAAAEFIEERRNVDREIQIGKRAVTTALQELAAYWQAESEFNQARIAVEDHKRRLAALAEKLQEGGAQPDDIKVLADAQRYGRAENFFSDISEKILNDIKRIENVERGILSIDENSYDDAKTFPYIKEIQEKINERKESILEKFIEIKGIIKNVQFDLGSAKTIFEEDVKVYRTKYDAARQRQAQHGELISDNEKITNYLKKAELLESQAASTELSKRPALDGYEDSKKKLDDLVARQHEILKKAAEQVESRSDGSLKARVKKDRSPTEYIQALCSMFEGSRFRDPTAHCDEWVKGMLQRDNGDGNEWKEICNNIIEIYKKKIMSPGVSDPGTEISSLIRNLFEDGRQTLTPAMVAKIYSNFTDQSVGLLLSAVPKPMITLTYMSDGRPIRFQDASPGQQASALLRLLLKQEAGTLIIDQPEDDLDNRVLMDVVNLIKEAKSKRQLIFATHNPNLVVNGDADKVVTMAATFPEDRAGPSAPRIQVRNDGAIETPTVKESITTIMEGGNKAFEMRARRYGHEISDNS